MAAGTITLTKISPVVSTPKSNRPVHVFLETGSENNFDLSQCSNYAQFTMNSSQGCVLITNLTALNMTLDINDLQTPLQFDMLNPLRLCYSIRVNQPGVALIVREKVPLTMLLNSGCISATPFCVTLDAWFKLFAEQDVCPGNKKRPHTMDSPSNAAKKKCK